MNVVEAREIVDEHAMTEEQAYDIYKHSKQYPGSTVTFATIVVKAFHALRDAGESHPLMN